MNVEPSVRIDVGAFAVHSSICAYKLLHKLYAPSASAIV